MNSMKELPPHVAANVGPTGAPTGQSHTDIAVCIVFRGGRAVALRYSYDYFFSRRDGGEETVAKSLCKSINTKPNRYVKSKTYDLNGWSGANKHDFSPL